MAEPTKGIKGKFYVFLLHFFFLFSLSLSLSRRIEKKVMGFTPAFLFPEGNGRWDRPPDVKEAQGAGIVKGWEDKREKE